MLRKPLLWLGVFVITICLFVLNILISAGYFKSIVPNTSSFEVDSYMLPGVEDMAIAQEDSFLILSSDDRAGRRDNHPKQGALYRIDLRDTTYTPANITTGLDFSFNPHGITLFKMDNSSYRLWAINHVKGNHSVELFNLIQDSLIHEKTIRDNALISPNDLVAVAANRFYITNDHGYTSCWGTLAENYLGLAVSNVQYYNGSSFTKVAGGIAYANGINADLKRNLMYVASPRAFELLVYNISSDGLLEKVGNIDVGTGIDNLTVDPEGSIWSAGHPQLLKFTAYARGKLPQAPTEVVKVTFRTKEDYTVSSLFMDDGSFVSAGSVAVPWNGDVFIGNVMDSQFIRVKDLVH